MKIRFLATCSITPRDVVKIAWILYGSIEQRTGGTIYDRLIALGLRRTYEVEIISLDRKKPDPFAIVRQLAKQRPDVVVGDELCHRELAVIFSRLSPNATKRVLLVHHRTCWEEELSENARRNARYWESIVVRHVDRTIATSNTTRERLFREGVRAPIDVVLPGADRLPRAQTTHATADEATRFLFLGAVIPRKRVRELIEAFTNSTQHAELRIAGSRSADPRYARSLSADRVVFLDEISDRHIASELAHADALVMPSSLEGYGIAATEAINAGVPVIAARTPGLAEALQHAGKAVLFVESQHELEKALSNFETNVALRHAMREAAARARSVMPSWEQAVAQFTESLNRALL